MINERGWRIPYAGLRVFSENPKWYYTINQPEINYTQILTNSKRYSKLASGISDIDFINVCENLKKEILNNKDLQNLFKGPHLPFIVPKLMQEGDIGQELENINLPSVANSFTEYYPDLHCKAILQGTSKLSGELRINQKSKYYRFREAQAKGDVIGWYFPQALQEYDVASQRAQMDNLSTWENLCLSGHAETAAVLVGTPGLLINKDSYPPVLCLSALEHNDPKLMLCFKAYGHHLEFWCMSQMLVPGVTQVSEQWTGGITIYCEPL